MLAWSLALLPACADRLRIAPGPLWLAAPALFVVGLVYMGVLSGLQTAVQLRAPAAYRGRVLSFFLVALGVAYPIGALVQGPVADHIGVGWTTVAAAADPGGHLFADRLAVARIRPGGMPIGRRPGGSHARAGRRSSACRRVRRGRQRQAVQRILPGVAR